MFPNVQNLMLMPAEALAKVSRPGKNGKVLRFGKSKAKKVFEFLHEDQLESDRAVGVEVY